jgi:hypothetical protein
MQILETFKGIAVGYERRLNVHRLLAEGQEGPWADVNTPVTYVTTKGDNIVGQAYTTNLPTLFALVVSDDSEAELIKTMTG